MWHLSALKWAKVARSSKKVLAKNMNLLNLSVKRVFSCETGKKSNSGLLHFRVVIIVYQILNKKRSIILNAFMGPVLFYFSSSFYVVAISNECNTGILTE